MSNTTDLDTIRGQQSNAPMRIDQFIDSMRGQMQRALPKHMDADRVARLTLTLVRKDPKLAACSLESFGAALMTSTALGLEPGVNGEAWLVPYGRECTFIAGYQGYVKLFWQSPLAKHIGAEAVHEADEFDYGQGLDPYLIHKPARGDRGAITDYYAVAALTNGAKAFTVLSTEQVKLIRGKTRPSNIADPMHWMERKTALRQLVKLLPKSVGLANVLQVDEHTGTELAKAQAPQQIAAAEPIAELEDGGQVDVEGEVHYSNPSEAAEKGEPAGWTQQA